MDNNSVKQKGHSEWCRSAYTGKDFKPEIDNVTSASALGERPGRSRLVLQRTVSGILPVLCFELKEIHPLFC